MADSSIGTDITIAQKAKLLPVCEIAKKISLTEEDIELYGNYKAKIKYEAVKRMQKNRDSCLVLVTAMTPTPPGEGKTTVTVGLGQAFDKLGEKSIICIREPSLGPVFGIKGGACGGGYSQVLPMEDINLHFTGDIHAVTAANNLISAVLDNHLYRGNQLQIDLGKITWHRCLDMNDRSLRNIMIGQGETKGVVREDHFDISVASEIMAILALAQDLSDLKARVEKIIVAIDENKNPVTVKDLKIAGAVTILLKDALKPNLVQTTENTPAFVHAGPFANIAHGCNSIVATKLALKLADYVVTEAGFGADLGAEKFLDIKCRFGKLKPKAVVVVATVRALKFHGGGDLEKGLPNLGKHIENIKKFGLELVVALNVFSQDSEHEIEEVINYCKQLNVEVSRTEVWAKGGLGGIDLAKKVLAVSKKRNKFHHLYKVEATIPEKINTIAKEIYGAKGVDFSEIARKQIKQYESWSLDKMPVCIAKTQYSLSDNPKLLGRPEDFIISVNSIKLSAGAGFLVAVTGNIMLMPGLPKVSAAEAIDIDKDGKIIGLF